MLHRVVGLILLLFGKEKKEEDACIWHTLAVNVKRLTIDAFAS